MQNLLGLYLLKIRIQVSDSGAGPFTEIKYLPNASLKDGIWTVQKPVKLVDHVLHEESVDIKELFRYNTFHTVTVESSKLQEGYYMVIK